MLFIIQSYLEDFLSRSNVNDTDGYAVSLANLYFFTRLKVSDSTFLEKIHHIKTVLFLNNRIKDRRGFEQSLIDRLDHSFKSKLKATDSHNPFPPMVEKVTGQPISRLTIDNLLVGFTKAIESIAIDSFWDSRKQGKLQHHPEKIAQGLLATYAKSEFMRGKGLVLREFLVGIGYVDVGIIISSALHLVEIKVMTDVFTGSSQLENYMKTEGRKEGSLLVIDATKPDRKIEFSEQINTPTGLIKVYRVDINPLPPSSFSK